MRVTIIGSGSASPHPLRVCAGHLAECGGLRILFDCGNGVLHRMARLGVDWSTITHVALSHFHYDHVGDLPALIVALQWGQLPPRSEPLTIIGPAGTKDWLTRLSLVIGDWLLNPGSFAVDVLEMEPGLPVSLSPRLPSGSPVSLSVHPVTHSPSSIAYSLSC